MKAAKEDLTQKAEAEKADKKARAEQEKAVTASKKCAATVLQKTDKARTAIMVTAASPFFTRLTPEFQNTAKSNLETIEALRELAKKALAGNEATFNRDVKEIDKMCANFVKHDSMLNTLMKAIASHVGR